MSWDVTAKITRSITISEVTTVYERDVTWNNAEIFYEALGRNFRELNGYEGLYAAPVILRGILNIEENLDEYKKLNPPNLWGGVEDALKVLNDLYEICIKYPECIVYIA